MLYMLYIIYYIFYNIFYILYIMYYIFLFYILYIIYYIYTHGITMFKAFGFVRGIEKCRLGSVDWCLKFKVSCSPVPLFCLHFDGSYCRVYFFSLVFGFSEQG